MARTTSRRVGGTRTISVVRESRIGAITAELVPAAQRGAAAAAEYARGLAVEQAPVETGNLRGSSFVEPFGEGARIVFDSPYAAIQHEVPMNHTPGNNGEGAGKDHYLSDPLRDNREDILQIMSKPVREALGG